uniref:DNA replication protein DnaC n=1 Tax=Candidatus Kentrum sp. FW TaxID=2126338 RepID=A0A450TKV5_9GAMM|nr:MAG: DNA replication protein DnaC [Candidatus Kentron sp. FW]
MLTHPTLDKLRTLKFKGMLKAFTEQLQMPDIQELSFEERLGLLVDREMTERENTRLQTRLRKAKLRQNACIEDIDYHHPRGLDKSLLSSLASCRWVAEHLNVLITGPTSVGKTWIACALAHKACREDFSAYYLRLPRLFQELSIAKGDGRYPTLLAQLAKTDVLIIDDWGLVKFIAEQRRDLLEILEDRHGMRSTIVTSQLPIEHWHQVIGDPTLADAILDRIVHNAYKLELKGDSLRKKQK